MNYAEGITDDAQNISEPKNEAKSLKAAIRSSGRWKAEAATVAKPFVDKLIRLAEVASQSEAYTSVIEELQKCLEIQKASFPADSRILAKTYYQNKLLL
ncbi:hypothetical protein DAPPUDRAFT_264721 [Daphnia pulex]|uniref:Uncharacterized protein n=1 Tax=Daphnia pulex TaxID=6669 RepID=E9HS62_DAPPU|nr:hypothetical protein DAPPUDRAFT_264721 [Daphnia pulex]|eukprot:EFX65421.1 hypothetical protein DAPPUDRAFT_264721 [Daphnia pulex]